MKKAAIALLFAGFCGVLSHAAQTTGNTGTVAGVVEDTSGAVVVGAQISIANPATGLARSAVSDSNGAFSFPNLPLNPYHLSITAPGFDAYAQDVSVRSAVAVTVTAHIKIGAAATTVQVTAEDLLENDSSFHTDVIARPSRSCRWRASPRG